MLSSLDTVGEREGTEDTTSGAKPPTRGS